MDWTWLYYSPTASGKFPPAGRSRFLGLHAGLTEGFDGGEEACSAGRAAGGAVLFDLTAVMSRQITKALASRETDQARLPRPLAF